MTDSKLDRLLAPWVFVLTGILFNIMSAVITHYFIGLNNEQINFINRDIQNRQVLIDSLWQARTEVERKKEFFILYLANKPEASALVDSYYQGYLRETLDSHNLEGFDTRLGAKMQADLALLLDVSSAAQASIIESINQTYFEILEKTELKNPLEKANARLFSIAIFLQVVGLILVLARDLRRH